MFEWIILDVLINTASDFSWECQDCKIAFSCLFFTVKLGDLQDAIESFERSLEMAKVQGDEPAEKAISKALEELNEKIVQGIKEGKIKDDEEDEGN